MPDWLFYTLGVIFTLNILLYCINTVAEVKRQKKIDRDIIEYSKRQRL